MGSRYTRLLGVYITEGGKHRRLDLVFTTPDDLPFCLLSWTGSTQFLRFLKQHAKDCGMKLTSHGCVLLLLVQACICLRAAVLLLAPRLFEVLPLRLHLSLSLIAPDTMA